MGFDIEGYLTRNKELVDGKLLELLPKVAGAKTRLQESMLYSIEAGGKRLRPVLAIAAGEAVGGGVELTLPVACAIEMVHTYSLIHDDLPAMDDDSLRRGLPTNHSVYGEAVAILAGDALLTEAFIVITEFGVKSGLTSSQAAAIVGDIARATGSRGMVGGQALDLALEGADTGVEEVEEMHIMKTAALIEAAVVSGGRAGGADEKQIESMRKYARALGLAFQIIDDVLDIEGGSEIGKERGADARKKKATYPAAAGLEGAKRRAAQLTDEAVECLRGFDERALPLREIACYLGGRKY
ncbi:MAG: farnesyl diphosphate synthase [Thermodesulfobacteriota bacterium]